MTTDCDDDRVEREIPALDGAAAPTPDPDAAILVTAPGDDPPLTARHELSVHDALCQGLASYLMSLSTSIEGRRIALSRVVGDWAEHDDGPLPAPTAMVGSVEFGKYSELALGMARPEKVAGDGTGRAIALTSSAFYELEELTVQVFCEDKVQRAGVRRMLEDGCSPVDWMAGFRLRLPRYHNAIGEYLLAAAQQPDATETAQAGVWPLVMRLTATCCVYQVRVLPLARIVTKGTIGGR